MNLWPVKHNYNKYVVKVKKKVNEHDSWFFRFLSLWLNNEKWIEEIHSTKIWVNRTFYIHAAHKVVKVFKNHLQDWKLMKVFLDGIFSYSPATIIGIFAPNERGKNDNKVGSSLLCIDITFLLSSYFYFGIAQRAHF